MDPLDRQLLETIIPNTYYYIFVEYSMNVALCIETERKADINFKIAFDNESFTQLTTHYILGVVNYLGVLHYKGSSRSLEPIQKAARALLLYVLRTRVSHSLRDIQELVTSLSSK